MVVLDVAVVVSCNKTISSRRKCNYNLKSSQNFRQTVKQNNWNITRHKIIFFPYLPSLLSSCPWCLDVVTANLTNQKILNINLRNREKFNEKIFCSYLFRLRNNIRWVENQNINFSQNVRHNAFNLEN